MGVAPKATQQKYRFLLNINCEVVDVFSLKFLSLNEERFVERSCVLIGNLN